MGSLLALLLALFACGSLAFGQEPPRPVLLDRHPERITSLTLPPSSRTEPAPERVPVAGPWRAVATVGGVRTWEAPLPVRLRALTFEAPPEDLAVFLADAPTKALEHLRGDRRAGTARTWSFDASSLRLRLPAGEGPPAPGGVIVRYARAAERERALNLESSGLDERAFALRSVQVDDLTRHGLYLPAPAEIAFTLDVPPGAVLDLDARIVPPEAADLPASDGAILRVSAATGGGEPRELARLALAPGPERNLRVDLSAHSGPETRIILATEPGASTTGDYVFLAEPTVYVPQEDPPRVILVVIDTLRADHLSLYGYDRPTSPELDAFAEGAAVFEQSRAISPWTLTSTRTLLLGTVPERWGATETLQSRLARAGWRTAFIASNGYLASTFDMHRDFGAHRVLNLGRAGAQVDRGLAWLEAHDDQPLFLVLHLMDQHLPYREPPWWRYHFAGERPQRFKHDSFPQREVGRMGALDDDERAYIVARYDNNLAYTDHELARLWAALDIQGRDTVLLTADHGEEFWEHGGFAHGHTVYDEVIRVPMVLAGAGVTPGRYTEPVSGLDVAPTLALAAGIDLEGMEGWPLQGVTDRSRATDFSTRAVAFGRFYGEAGWGVLSEGVKLAIKAGKEQLFYLSSDPGEDLPRAPHPLERAKLQLDLAQTLATPVRVALRVTPLRNAHATRAELRVPGGVEAAWANSTPSFARLATVEVDGERVTMQWRPGKYQDVEIFVLPRGDLRTVLPAITLAVAGEDGALAPPRGVYTGWTLEALLEPSGDPLVTATVGERVVTVHTMATPLPYQDLGEGTEHSNELQGALEALGYMDN